MAPVIENQTPAQASNTAKASAPSIKLSINAVTKPKYTITAPGHPAIARASLLSALSESRATIAPSEDSSEFAPTSAVHVIPSAPGLPKAAVSAPKHERAMVTPGRPVIAHASRQSTDAIDRLLAAGQLDESTPAAVAGAGYAKVTPPISVPRVSLRKSPAAHKPLTQMASASIGIDNIPAGHVPTLTHIEAARISAQAAEETQDIADHGVSEPSLTKAVLRNVRGEYQVVYDNRRVELDRPLQDRGSVLFAPLRRIFESQGGQLAWDHVKRQVHAVNQGTDIVVTIGSKKAVVNNQTVRMSGAPYLFNSRTMLPLDFVGVALDAKVSYDAATGHMIIESR
jgi:hypothetical protein